MTYGIDLSGAGWRKSTRSQQSGNCIEVAAVSGGRIAVRDSKNPAWSALVATSRSGRPSSRGSRPARSAAEPAAAPIGPWTAGQGSRPASRSPRQDGRSSTTTRPTNTRNPARAPGGTAGTGFAVRLPRPRRRVGFAAGAWQGGGCTGYAVKRRLICYSTPTTRWTGGRGEEEAMREAEAADVPSAISIWERSCHGLASPPCHVMARESFEDEATAALMNEHFVSDQGGPRGAAGRGRGLHGRPPRR